MRLDSYFFVARPTLFEGLLYLRQELDVVIAKEAWPEVFFNPATFQW